MAVPAPDSPPPVAILCGGRGTRLRQGAESIPKPLVEIGDQPIVWHVIQIYAVQGFTDFLLLTGYRGELVEEFASATEWPDGVAVRCLDTGLDTATGGRLHAARAELGEGTACVTYADGVADIDLGALLAYHRSHSAAATMTVVRPELQFGVTNLDGDGRVTGFVEKPRSDQWINGGFFCFEPAAFDYLAPDSTLERAPLEQLAAADALRAYRHTGFWECMDTYKDAIQLNDLWEGGRAPWRSW